MALVNGLNANLLRRRICEFGLPAKPATLKRTKTLPLATQTQFIPLELQASGAPANVQIELQRGARLVAF